MHITGKQLLETMKARLHKVLLVILLILCLPLQGAENNDGNLGVLSTGNIDLVLEVNHTVAAGFLSTNLDDPKAEYQNLSSYRLLESLQQNRSTIIPLCVISSEGGAFSIDSYEAPGMENSMRSEFGASLPFDVMIGDSVQSDFRYRAVTDECNADVAIPITIRTRDSLNGSELGRMSGQFNLLIKME